MTASSLATVSVSNRDDVLRSILTIHRHSILTSMGRVMTNGTSNDGCVKDAGEQSVSDHDAHVAASRADILSKQLSELDRAERRLEQGHYGTCTDCEEDIEPKRLEAIPFAVRCKDCQEAKETRTSSTHKARLGFPRASATASAR